MDKCVKLYHLGLSYKVYNDDAKIVFVLVGFNLKEDKKNNLVIEFSDKYLNKVLDALNLYKVNYILPYDANILKDFQQENKYDKFLNLEINLKEIKNKPIKGNFVVKFNDEYEEKFIIGDNISEKAKLVNIIKKNKIGKKIHLYGHTLTIISKNIN